MDDETELTDNSLKAISETADELRVGNYIVLFGGRDLAGFNRVGATRAVATNADGSQGEFFSERTQLESDYTAMGRLPVDWEHGHEKAAEGLGEDDLLGYVDWGTKRVDPKGVWVERVLNRRKAYVKWVEELIRANLVGTSSRTVPGRGKKAADGEITEWPLYRDTLTVQPYEPRMLGENVITAMKALGLSTDAPAENGSTVSPGASESQHSETSDETKGLTDMDEKEVMALWDKREAERQDKAAADAKALADRDEAIKAAVEKERKVWEAEAKAIRNGRGSYTSQADENTHDEKATIELYQSLRNSPEFQKRVEYWQATKATRDEAKSFMAAVRGDEKAMGEFKASNATDMNIGTPADGGYAVPVGHYQGIIAKSDESRLSGPLGVMNIPGKGTTVDVPFDDGTANEFVSTGETSDEDEDAPVLNRAQMTYVVYTKGITLSAELLRDEDSRLMAFLDNYVGRAHARTHNSLLVTALAAGATAYNLASASTIAATEIPGIVYELKDQYGDNAKWLMKRSTEGIIRALAGNFWQFAPTPPGGGFKGTLWGDPIYHSVYCTAPAANAKSMYYGDFSYVGLREDPQLFFLRDPYSLAKKRQTVLHYYFSAVYKVLIAEAILRATHPSA